MFGLLVVYHAGKGQNRQDKTWDKSKIYSSFCVELMIFSLKHVKTAGNLMTSHESMKEYQTVGVRSIPKKSKWKARKSK